MAQIFFQANILSDEISFAWIFHCTAPDVNSVRYQETTNVDQSVRLMHNCTSTNQFQPWLWFVTENLSSMSPTHCHRLSEGQLLPSPVQHWVTRVVEAVFVQHPCYINGWTTVGHSVCKTLWQYVTLCVTVSDILCVKLCDILWHFWDSGSVCHWWPKWLVICDTVFSFTALSIDNRDVQLFDETQQAETDMGSPNLFSTTCFYRCSMTYWISIVICFQCWKIYCIQVYYFKCTNGYSTVSNVKASTEVRRLPQAVCGTSHSCDQELNCTIYSCRFCRTIFRNFTTSVDSLKLL